MKKLNGTSLGEETDMALNKYKVELEIETKYDDEEWVEGFVARLLKDKFSGPVKVVKVERKEREFKPGAVLLLGKGSFPLQQVIEVRHGFYAEAGSDHDFDLKELNYYTDEDITVLFEGYDPDEDED
jgi:hypothetical protein